MADAKHEHDVTIEINGKHYEVRPGPTPVSELKRIGGVPAADQLEQIIHGKLEPLADDGSVDVKAGDKFVSHTRTGSSG